jgi:hypothetical protein
MRGLKTDLGARVVIAGHAFLQNLHRGHYELAVDGPVKLRTSIAIDQLAAANDVGNRQGGFDHRVVPGRALAPMTARGLGGSRWPGP